MKQISRFFAPPGTTAWIALALVSTLALSGCGGVLSGPPMLNGTAIATLPEGCVSSSSITAETAGYLKKQTFTPVNSWLKIWSSTADRGQLVFSTYPVTREMTYGDHTYSDTDALVVVNFEYMDKLPVGVGNYSSAPDAKIKVTAQNVSSKGVSGGVFDKNGTLEISHMDAKYACGKMKFNDGRNMLEGNLIAEVARL